MTARVGPVAAKFKGKLTLSDLKPPHSYSIAFEGQGGVAGFGKGGAAGAARAPRAEGTQLDLPGQGQRRRQARADRLAARRRGGAQARRRLLQGVQRDGREPARARRRITVHEEHEDHHPEPVPRDPDLPDVPPSSLAFFAAGTLVVFVVALVVLF